MKHALAASALALILAACSPEAPAPADAPADAPAAEAPGAPVPAGIREALLEADGVTLADPAGGAGRKLTFGEPEAEVIAFVTGLNGGQPVRRGSNDECGAGRLTFAYLGDYFELAFSEGKLAGWTASEAGARGFATASGVHVGATLAQVRAADPAVTVTEDTLGPEFEAAGVYGFLNGKTDAAVVTGLWAGTSCFFR